MHAAKILIEYHIFQFAESKCKFFCKSIMEEAVFHRQCKTFILVVFLLCVSDEARVGRVFLLTFPTKLHCSSAQVPLPYIVVYWVVAYKISFPIFTITNAEISIKSSNFYENRVNMTTTWPKQNKFLFRVKTEHISPANRQ